MTTQALMKACKSKGKYFNMARHKAGARTGWLPSSSEEKKPLSSLGTIFH